MRALDLCTGSGCVAISLARERPTSSVVATDVSGAALGVAKDNALRLGAYNVAFLEGDLFRPLDSRWRFDVVVANPPYIPTPELATLDPDVRDFEPRQALDGGADGLDVLRRVVTGAADWLEPGGVLAVEVGAGEAAQVARAFESAAFRGVEIRRDYGRIERVVSGVLEGHGP
jgi:release factor glutamine methyltransferase